MCGDCPTKPDLTGKVLDGRYEVKKLLSDGGQARVFSGTDLKTGVAIAIKSCLLHGDEVKKRFFSEARAVARLFGHPNIVAILGIGDWADEQGCVYGWIVFEQLQSDLSELDDTTLVDRLKMLVDCCSGLQYAHIEGVFHRDIKPDNLFRSPGGTAKVGDFGLSVEAVLAPEPDGAAPADHSFVGTFQYMAPEMHAKVLRILAPEASLALTEGVDANFDLVAIDVFALGATIFRVLTGRSYLPMPPSNHSFDYVVVARHYLEQIKSSKARLNITVSSSLQEVIAKCLSIKASERPTSVAEVRAALEAELLLADQASDAPNKSTQVADIRRRAHKALPVVVNIRSAIRESFVRTLEALVKRCNIKPDWILRPHGPHGARTTDDPDWYVSIMLRPSDPAKRGVLQDVLVPIYRAHYEGPIVKHSAEWSQKDSDLRASLRIERSCSGLPIEWHRIADGEMVRDTLWTRAEAAGYLDIVPHDDDGRISAVVLPKISACLNRDLSGENGELVRQRYRYLDEPGSSWHFRNEKNGETHEIRKDLKVEIVVPLYGFADKTERVSDEHVLGIINFEWAQSFHEDRIRQIVNELSRFIHDERRFAISRFTSEVVHHVAWDN